MDRIIQTSVTDEVATAIHARSTADGVSVAAWVRRAVFRELSPETFEAWPVEAKSAAQPVEQDRPANHRLRLIERISATAMVCALHHVSEDGPLGARVSVGWLTDPYTRGNQWYAAPAAWRFRLRGSSTPWRIVTTTFDPATEEMRVVLELDAGVRPEVMKAVAEIMATHAETLSKLAK